MKGNVMQRGAAVVSATPGPWRYLPGGQGQEYPIVQRGRSGGFVVADEDIVRAHADALLIAAAPRMSDALWSLLVAVGQLSLTPEQRAIVAAACDEASAALIESGRVLG